jgi:hypothetical protein
MVLVHLDAFSGLPTDVPSWAGAAVFRKRARDQLVVCHVKSLLPIS